MKRRERIATKLLHPGSVATLALEDDAQRTPDQPFAGGTAGDVLDADLRHRIVSEAAFHHLAERGYEEGGENDDWRDAQAEIDHVLLNPSDKASPEGGK